MATVQPWTPIMNDKIWTEEEKALWLAEHGATATHVVTFEPMYQVEVCIPPWEHPDRQIARSAVGWGKDMSRVLDGAPVGSGAVVAAHNEGNSLEVYTATVPRPRLRRLT